MAIGMGDGGEQNAPLGRAVIGGLLVATCTTLIFVPLMYSVLRHAEPDPNHVNSKATPNPPVRGQIIQVEKSNLVKE